MRTNKALTKPTSEPVSLSLVKTHIAVDHSDDDALIVRQIKAARSLCEEYTGRVFGSRNYRMRLSCWPDGGIIAFPVQPVTAITSITYIDADGDSQAVNASNWRANLDANPPYLRLVTGFTYPVTDPDEPAAITVLYTAGDAADDVPELVENAVLLIVQYWRNFPGGEPSLGHLSLGMPAGAIALLDKLWDGGL